MICLALIPFVRSKQSNNEMIKKRIKEMKSKDNLVLTPVLHSKTKHIEVRYHFIRDHVMNGDIELHFVPTEYQLADLFTKPLDVTRFNMLLSELGMLNPEE
ncbi:hypothetical protein OSB04_un000790 [Centaurea solstitialis]|uniref:Copia protein n=1 Tax=Centaurea solstitialis TaxID=347529 RepID=A0AA38W392_9ASTR|nr:hypothetical protein OSB04_un000790 [Centaurea solstitialis]